MNTGLWAAASGLAAIALTETIPPACRRAIDVLHRPTAIPEEGDVIVEGPEWPVGGATHFVPSFGALGVPEYSVRLELSVRIAGVWSPWVAGVGLGPATFAPPAPPAEGLDADIDEFRTREPAEAARVRLRFPAPHARAVLDAESLLTLSATDASPIPPRGATAVPGVRLEVPRRSQMDADPAIAARVCSPTCVAMVLDFWQRPVALDPLAAEMLHRGVDLYGVWPAAIVAAGRRGLAGYLLRFPDWAAAAWCLARGLPVVASVRYAAGELTGAAVTKTAGHLIVLTGWEGDEALVNDPGAPSAASVARRYRLDELQRVWLERAGVGYVMFPPAGFVRGG